MKLIQFFVKKSTVKPCVECVHFIKDTIYGKYDEPDDENNGKCKIFSEINVVTGQIKHDYALQCRYDNSLCGMDGKHFRQNDTLIK